MAVKLKIFVIKKISRVGSNHACLAVISLDSENDPRTLLRKVIHKCYLKRDPQTLLKNWLTNTTQKLAHRLYSKSHPVWQEVLKITFFNSVLIVLKYRI